VRLATASVVGATSLIAALGVATTAHADAAESSSYLSDLNAERVAHGLRPLTERADLDSVAQRWADHMAAADVLSHNPALTSQVANWQTVGENVGEGPDVASLDAAFWNSPGHRANILDTSYTEVGLGSTWSNGVLWITVDFRKPMVSTSRSTVARPRTTSGHRLLHLGSRGHDVARVQRRLHVRADGIFGHHTKRAVARFQRRHHLRATGVVNPRTWRALHPGQ
jgi:peptidoglycan hydrolase-like protein with peptidoglycan-binding domain